MLLRIDAGKVVLLVVMLGLVGLAGQAHARIDDCRNMQPKLLRCVLSLD